ncbi:hypothetical protein CsSME_00047394 [Camellia sinensis var. sinensis]
MTDGHHQGWKNGVGSQKFDPKRGDVSGVSPFPTVYTNARNQKQTRQQDLEQRGRELTRDEEDSEGKEVAKITRKTVQRQVSESVRI